MVALLARSLLQVSSETLWAASSFGVVCSFTFGCPVFPFFCNDFERISKAVTQLAISIKFCSISLLQLATTWLSVFLNADDDVTYAASSVCVYNLPGRESEALPEGKHFRETVAHVKSQGSNVSHGRKTGVEIASTWRSRGAFLPETNTVPMTMSRVCFLISSDNTNNIASVILGIFSNDCASFHRFIYFSTS